MTIKSKPEPELESVIYDALIENEGYYAHYLADRLAVVVRDAGFVWRPLQVRPEPMKYNPNAVVAAALAMCRELYGDNFDLHDHGAQDPDARASLERAAAVAVEAYLEEAGSLT